MAKQTDVKLRPKVAYPWDEWFKPRKTAIELVKGRDYHCTVRAFVIYAREVASRRGLKLIVNVSKDGNRVLMQRAAK